MSDNISLILSMATVRYLGPTVVSSRGLGPMESKMELELCVLAMV